MPQAGFFKRDRDEEDCWTGDAMAEDVPVAVAATEKIRRTFFAVPSPLVSPSGGSTGPVPMSEADCPMLPGLTVRVHCDPQIVDALHAYPFYGTNPSPASYCGAVGQIVATGAGEWGRGVVVRFCDGSSWPFNPKALQAHSG
eukprot:Sspe_Gene.38263::Locus_18442_Transcript_1_1_Confidence_1.000_Length_681::g.38263::m.38263